MDVKSIIAGAVKIDGASPEEIYSALSPTPDIKKGDLCLPCFKFAKAARKSPQLIAEELKTSVDSGGCALIERTAVEGGYLNFYFDRRVFARDVLLELEKNGGAVNPKPANGVSIILPSTLPSRFI